MNKKSRLLLTTTLLTIIGVVFNIFTINVSANVREESEKLSIVDLDYSEVTSSIVNPERGYYVLSKAYIADDYNAFTNPNPSLSTFKKIAAQGNSLVSLQINISPYTENELSEIALLQIENTFNSVRQAGLKAIVRVVYDSKGVKYPEPEDFSLILRHLDQLKPIYDMNEDIIYVVEAGMLGPWGEGHNTKYDELEYRKALVDKLMEIVPQSRMVSVRTPKMYRDIFGDNPITISTAFNGSNASRLSQHNDGFLGSSNDYGTYKTWTREEELQWLNSHTRYSMYGGEVIKVTSEYNNLDNAIYEMGMTHCQYINGTYDLDVKEKWKNSTYVNENSVYNNLDGETYIKDHLGYRYVLRSSKLTKEIEKGELGQAIISIENVGFGNLINKRNAELVLVNGETQIVMPINGDPRFWEAGEVTDINIDINTSNLECGNWDLYIKLPDISESLYNNVIYSIKFANNNIWNDSVGGNYIGTISVVENNEIVE